MSNIIPPELVQRLAANPLFETDAFLATHEQGTKTTSVRFNQKKPFPHDTTTLNPVPWCDTGYYLDKRPVFTLDPFFHAGCYYVQEASSMFVAHALRALGLDRHPLIAIDVCAAPGGKSTLLNSYLHPDSLLIANELIRPRAKVLADNLVRWGTANTVVTKNDPVSFQRLPGYADLMLVDAPCSGSGMFRKDPGTIDDWSLGAVKLCGERQQRILASSLTALKTGGVLLYSTCSYSEEENERIADWLVETQGMQPLALPVDPEWGIEETASPQHACPGYRFYPHRLRGEGFFIAAFRKEQHQDTFDRKKVKLDTQADRQKLLSPWLGQPSDFTTFQMDDELFIFPKGRETDLQILRNVLYLKNAGRHVGKIVRNELVPDHGLALSNDIHPDLPQATLDLEQALAYLHKAPIDAQQANPDGRTGWALANHQGVNLGWLKLMPSRINNYYPKEWRIMNL